MVVEQNVDCNSRGTAFTISMGKVYKTVEVTGAVFLGGTSSKSLKSVRQGATTVAAIV